ncbi:BTB/POZ domain-containing protein 6-B-like [Teleopsis dalmanni]|uniref:BTB/POZ domain-containing protein 6-B-like n=1 Tax=Teleopsis dalmanni TaxID=139649 RepID=UPI0018CE86FA|nr:BTB/POZ domain-containing protein 6-B-like [Teleopsis dalmanni]
MKYISAKTMSSNDLKKWNELSELERLDFIKNSATDCIFIVGKTTDEIQRISCHKKVLAECSDVFSSMFSGNYFESEKNYEISLDDVSPRAFQFFVTFIYFGVYQGKNSMKDLAQLAYLSDKYMICPLSTACETEIKDKLKCAITLSELVELLKYQVFRQYHKMIESLQLKWDYDDFRLSSPMHNLCASGFTVLLKKLSKILSAADLFEIVENYVTFNFIQEKNDKNLHDTEIMSGSNTIIIELFLSKVRFQDMTAAEFCGGPIKSSLLNVNRKLNILIEISKKYIPKKRFGYYNGNSYVEIDI